MQLILESSLKLYVHFHPMGIRRHKKSLSRRFSPSPPCSCEVCLGFCARPGWWTVSEAAQALAAGYGSRMMLEMAPDLTFGVLSPAFCGCEGFYAINEYKDRGCNFLKENLCELHGTGFQPLECRFCHHDRPGQGPICHAELEKDWHTPAAQVLVQRWAKIHLDGKGS
jgi:hypothetical protein